MTSSLESTIIVETTNCIVCGSENHSHPVAHGQDFEYNTSNKEFQFVECMDCGHLYLNPRPAIESAELIYPQSYYTFSSDRPSLVARILGRVKDWVVTNRIRTLVDQIPQGGTVTEVGCGDGATLIAIRKLRPDLAIVGIDLQFSEAHRSHLHTHQIEIVESPLEYADLNHKFDLVIMNQLIEHLWDCRACLEKLTHVMAPGGLISIATPNLDGYDRRWFRDQAWGGYHFPRHLNLFTERSLHQFLQQFGFEVVQSKQLVAPLVWVTNIHNALKLKNSRLYHYFTYSNLLALAVFTITDRIALAIGSSTSNQQVIIRKISA